MASTLKVNTIQEYDGNDITLDASGDIVIDADGDNISFKAGGTNPLDFANSSGQWTINNGTDAKDIIFTQYDDDVVARVHDGGTATTIETGTLDLTVGAAGKGGFGFKRPVYNVTPGVDDQECTLTMAHSGAIIMVTGAAYDLDISLPAIAAGDEGWHITIVITTAFSSSNNLEIATNGHGDATDTIHLYSNAAGTTAADVAGGDVVRTQADPVAGTKLEFTCLKGGAAEQWICESIVPSGNSPTVVAGVA